MCRKSFCGYFGSNSDWVKHIERWKFRCPMCGYQHAPWATSDGGETGEADVAAARILSVVCPETGTMKHIPTTNPATHDEQWLNKQIEIAALKIETQSDLDQWYAKASVDYKKLLEKESLEHVFERMEYNPLNHRAVIDTRVFDDRVHKERGYVLGTRMTDLESSRKPFSDWNGLISVVANYVAVSRAIAHKL